MNQKEAIERLISSRPYYHKKCGKVEKEGGCGVIGVACSEKVAGKHLIAPLKQMCNRGNGKGGGIAAAGLDPQAFGVSQKVLENDYLLAIGYLDIAVQKSVEEEYVRPVFEVDHVHTIPRDFIQGLEIMPPLAVVYFVRVKEKAVSDFKKLHEIRTIEKQDIEDEIVYQNSRRLNNAYYNPSGKIQAFVLSHGKNLIVLKMVGFGDDVIRCYHLENFRAHVWIGHHRYPTKGKVWHPGGAHPFVGLHEALVHNGDFANYASITEYLSQRNIYPHFLTDTEVGALVFDLLTRTYRYPLEYAIECLAPTTELDFALLPVEKQKVYKALQRTHMHGSPDGPWFFLIAQSKDNAFRLIGVTDTSMLRPQVFAIQEGELSIGFAASEKQAIDAFLESLSADDSRIWSHADRYWNARGGSHTDGGAFHFAVHPFPNASARMVCTDKFGKEISIPQEKIVTRKISAPQKPPPDISAPELFLWVKSALSSWGYEDLQSFLRSLEEECWTDEGRSRAIGTLTLLFDRRYPLFAIKRSRMLSFLTLSLIRIASKIGRAPTSGYAFLKADAKISPPESGKQTLVLDAAVFPADGKESLARKLVGMVELGFKKFIIYNCKGHRFIGNGMGAYGGGVRIDIFGSSGDYLASGIDGAEIYVHGNAQDQLAQIMKSGKLVIYGDVGQTFLYAAKGGKAFVLGNAAGRPLINAVGVPRVVINGTCLDYLAESFMAGDPLEKGGFAVLNGIAFNDNGELYELDTPYPGSNLFSLASGGAVYIRDPEFKISSLQLNGGEIVPFLKRDWDVVLPYLKENEELFDIPVSRLLEHKGKSLSPSQMYRKIHPGTIRALEPEEAWVKKKAK